MNSTLKDKLSDARKLYVLAGKVGPLFLRTGWTNTPAASYYKLVAMLLKKEALSSQFSEDGFFDENSASFEDYGVGYTESFQMLLDDSGCEPEPYYAAQLLYTAMEDKVVYYGFTEEETLEEFIKPEGADVLRDFFSYLELEERCDDGEEDMDLYMSVLREEIVGEAQLLAKQLSDCRNGKLDLEDAYLLDPIRKMAEDMFCGFGEEELFLKHFFGICMLLFSSYMVVDTNSGTSIGLRFRKFVGDTWFLEHMDSLPEDDEYVQMAFWCLEKLTDSFIRARAVGQGYSYVSDLAGVKTCSEGVLLTTLVPCLDGWEDTMFLPEFSFLVANYILPVLAEYLKEVYGQDMLLAG